MSKQNGKFAVFVGDRHVASLLKLNGLVEVFKDCSDGMPRFRVTKPASKKVSRQMKREIEGHCLKFMPPVSVSIEPV